MIIVFGGLVDRWWRLWGLK